MTKLNPCPLCFSRTAKGIELIFISVIKRDGSGTLDLLNEDMSVLDDTNFNINGLSITNETYIASSFNVYVVKFKSK